VRDTAAVQPYDWLKILAAGVLLAVGAGQLVLQWPPGAPRAATPRDSRRQAGAIAAFALYVAVEQVERLLGAAGWLGWISTAALAAAAYWAAAPLWAAWFERRRARRS
jgi:hypothetical protein